MPYREKKIYSGNMLEVEIFPITVQERKHSRKRKVKETTCKQKNLNDKNAKKHLIRLLNTNFTDKDLSVTLTYDNKHLPETEAEARKDVTNFLRRVKHYIKKNKLEELKYIAVIEYKEQQKGKKIRIHHHLVINGVIDRDTLENLWKKGRANADRLKSDEFGYEALARYISKDPKGNRRWTQSRNLKQPEIKVNDYKFSKRKVLELSKCQGEREIFEKLYKGYVLRDYQNIVNEIVDSNYLYIKLQKLKN